MIPKNDAGRWLTAAKYHESKGDFQNADRCERMARQAQISQLVPQNVLESVHSGVGGGNVNGQLGGLHVEMNVTPPSQNQAAKEAAISVLTSGGFVSEEAIAAAASSHGADPQETKAWVDHLYQLTAYSGNDPNLLRQLADQSGNVQMNLATQTPGSNFQSWGDITGEDILHMHEERGHGGRRQSNPEKYMNIANPGADMPKGFGGGIVPQQYWQSVRDQYMSGRGPEEWGADEEIWQKKVVPKQRRRLQQMMQSAGADADNIKYAQDERLCHRCKGYGVYQVRVDRYDTEDEYCQCPAGEERWEKDLEKIKAQTLKNRIRNTREPFRMAGLP